MTAWNSFSNAISTTYFTAVYKGYVHNSMQNYNYVGKYPNKTLDFNTTAKKFLSIFGIFYII